MKYCLFLLLIWTPILHAQVAGNELCIEDESSLANTVCLYQKPLLVGASVTQGYGANNGGASSIIAKEFNPDAEITNIARGGAESTVSLKDHQIPNPAPSVVIGMDLFFWDAVRKNCDENFEVQTKKFFKMYQDKNIPMILGKLPKGLTFPTGYNFLNTNECTDKINALLEKECTIDKNCLVYDPKECFAAMVKENDPDKQKKYFVDRLHTSVAGNKFCAKEFIATASYKKLVCPKSNP